MLAANAVRMLLRPPPPSFTIFDIADIVKSRSNSGNDTVSAEGIMAPGNGTDASVTDDVSPGLAAAAAIVLGYRPNGNYTHATLAATLLALPDEDPRKHKVSCAPTRLSGACTPVSASFGVPLDQRACASQSATGSVGGRACTLSACGLDVSTPARGRSGRRSACTRCWRGRPLGPTCATL